MTPTFFRTRIAPTPSGFLHLGNVLSFVLTEKLGRQRGARVLLRIDDLDRERVEARYVEDVFETLDFLGIKWEEGPRGYGEYEASFSQVHRMGLYEKALGVLRDSGLLYACSCSRTQIMRSAADGVYPGTCADKGIPLDAAGVSWRLRTDDRELGVKQVDGNTAMARLPVNMHDFIVRRKDGSPAYQLASIVDDLHFGVDLIVRGQDLWSSTLAQLYLAGLLPGGAAFAAAGFYHHELLMEEGGGKLSKSAGSTSIQFLRREGKSAGDIYGMIGQIQ